jgi:hypothetical protein
MTGKGRERHGKAGTMTGNDRENRDVMIFFNYGK